MFDANKSMDAMKAHNTEIYERGYEAGEVYGYIKCLKKVSALVNSVVDAELLEIACSKEGIKVFEKSLHMRFSERSSSPKQSLDLNEEGDSNDI